MSSTDVQAAAGILGIDLGKYRSVACRMAEDREIAFDAFATTKENLRTLLERRSLSVPSRVAP